LTEDFDDISSIINHEYHKIYSLTHLHIYKMEDEKDRNIMKQLEELVENENRISARKRAKAAFNLIKYGVTF
jgi:hypothetical protein